MVLPYLAPYVLLSGCAASSASWMRGVQLRAAHGQPTSIGMEAFAERARKELQATGQDGP